MVETELPKPSSAVNRKKLMNAGGGGSPQTTSTTATSSPENSTSSPTKRTGDIINDSLNLEIPPICAILEEQKLLSEQNGCKTVQIINDYSADDAVVVTAPPSTNYRVYKWRWYVLTVVALLNCLNALSWIAYAPVANKVDDFYGKDVTFYLTVVFLVAAIPVGIVGMWSVGKFGLRSAILTAAWLNGVGSVIRVLSSFEFAPINWRFIIVLSGQVVAACAYPFIMFLPTKVAAAWFPDTQRTTANTIATMANPLGVLLAMLLSPNLVLEKSDVLYLNLLICICCVAATLMATIGVRSSRPPTPPTRGAAETSMPFVAGILKLIKSRSFLILFFALGAGIGMFNAMYGMMQQILCARGYSNAFAGICCVCMIVGGFAGAFSSGLFVDKTKKFEETMKVAFAVAVLGGISFSLCALRSDFAAPIAVSCVVFGFFGLAAYPLGLEMSVECSFPVAETMSSGLIVLSGQIQSALLMAGMKVLRTPLRGPDLNVETCSDGDESSVVIAYDMTLPLIVFCAVAAGIISFFILVFRPKLRRLNLERENAKLAKHAAKSKEEQEMIDLRAQRAKEPNSPLA